MTNFGIGDIEMIVGGLASINVIASVGTGVQLGAR